MSWQIPLALQFNYHCTFDQFVVGDNHALLTRLRSVTQDTAPLFIYGSRGRGKSHLLQACCHTFTAQSLQAGYLPLQQLLALSPAIVEGFEHFDLLCIDDVDAIAGHQAWEEALFHCYNRAQLQGCRLVFAASETAQQLPIALRDLKSRLCACLAFGITSLNDADKITVLIAQAKQRGLQLPEEAAIFLLKNYERELTALLKALDRLDQASLSTKRRLTIPFIKRILEMEVC